MRGLAMFFAATLLLFVSGPAAADGLEAGGVQFEPTISVSSDNGEHQLRCTGTALRKKFFFKVYAAAAYLETGTDAGDDAGATFVDANVPKRLHLQMLRDVESEKIISSIDEAFEKCATTPLAEIEGDRVTFREAFSMEKLEKGQDIRFTWLPGIGLQLSVDHSILDTIQNPVFAKSFFEIYFGPEPVNDDMKKDLLQLETE
jgi:hypothetical protein